MRPSDITDGIGRSLYARSETRASRRASMRPSDITDGIPTACYGFADSKRAKHRFNEAVGYYRRNLRLLTDRHTGAEEWTASMRPSDITDGIAAPRRPLAR